MNVDIGGRSAGPLVGRDSNPGTVTVSMGGVGRNIAHNLRLLGVRVSLPHCLGGGSPCRPGGRLLRAAGYRPEPGPPRPWGAPPPPTFSSATRRGTWLWPCPTWVSTRPLPRPTLPATWGSSTGAALVVADANLPQEALDYLAHHCTAPLFGGPGVHRKRRRRCGPSWVSSTPSSPTGWRQSSCRGVAIRDLPLPYRRRGKLLETGLQRVFISLGTQGVFAADHPGRVVPLLPDPDAQRHRGGGTPSPPPWPGPSWRGRTWPTAPGQPMPPRPSP